MRILFTGHVVCKQPTFNFHDDVIEGLAIRHGSTACISGRSEDFDHEAIILIHEFGHLYGAKDHYGKNSDDYVDTKEKLMIEFGPGYVFEDNCIYGLGRDNLTDPDNLEICDGCSRLIKEGIEATFGAE